MEPGHLDSELIRPLLDTCSVPDNAQLADRLHCSARDLERCFDELAEQHGVVLHPNSHRVRVVHPFSLAPTPFLVTAGARRWWGNCAWCSLGVASLIDGPCTITTSLGAEEERVVISVANGRVTADDLLVHFPIPMARAWDNVVYELSMLVTGTADAHTFDAESWPRALREGFEVVEVVGIAKPLVAKVS